MVALARKAVYIKTQKVLNAKQECGKPSVVFTRENNVKIQ